MDRKVKKYSEVVDQIRQLSQKQSPNIKNRTTETQENFYAYANEEEVNRILSLISESLNGANVLTVNVIMALSLAFIEVCQGCGVTKPHILTHISNYWELLDVKNDE